MTFSVKASAFYYLFLLWTSALLFFAGLWFLSYFSLVFFVFVCIRVEDIFGHNHIFNMDTVCFRCGVLLLEDEEYGYYMGLNEENYNHYPNEPVCDDCSNLV
jgi:hypothetical protein